MSEESTTFDFEAHGREATAEYLQRRVFFQDLSSAIKRILDESLKRKSIKVHSVDARAKDPLSFSRKAAQPDDNDPKRPKYKKPLDQIFDLAAARVISFFPDTLTEIDRVISDEFKIVERSDKGAELIDEERFGYRSIHYLVSINAERAKLPEYSIFAAAIAEIQVRTILQHAWAEIEHDIQYKSTSVIPATIRRRFMSLAGLLEIADREFQAIQDADKKLAMESRSLVEDGRLAEVEITPASLKTFLDKRLGEDGRISDYSYDWTARLLRKLGFRTLEKVDKCIKGFDDDQICRILSGNRQGQTVRFEFLLLAGMGKSFTQRHPWANQKWFSGWTDANLEKLRKANIQIREFNPEE